MSDPQPEAESRKRYEEALVQAMEVAERHLPHDQALEIAHDVAIALLALPHERVSGALIYFAVTNRVRSQWRAAQRRTKAESAYHNLWSCATSSWANPGSELVVEELQDRISACVAAMPPAMKEVFLLIRVKELSYKEVAGQLGIAPGTVHAHFSRASTLLRRCVDDYMADKPIAKSSRRNPSK